MAREQAKRIVGDAASRPEQDHRHGLMRHLQDVGSQRVLASHEMQAAIDDAEFSALQPDQAVPVGMRNTGRFQTESSLQHDPAGLSSNMPKPKARCRPTPLSSRRLKAGASPTCK
jgi:hypothetical protein